MTKYLLSLKFVIIKKKVYCSITL